MSKSALSPWSTSTIRCGSSAGDLAAELGADRAAGAGDEHGLAREVRGDRLEVDLDRLAAEQVLHLDRADLDREVAVAGDQLVQARQRLHRHVLGCAPSRRSGRASRPTPTGSRSAPRRDGGRGAGAGARRSCRARGSRAGAGSSCAGRRRSGRSACSRAQACAASRAAPAGRRRRRRRRSPPCRARRSSGSAAAR